ncbi:AIR carboxylase family protein [Candidatus Bathyarchaeota archaeon]|nr:AIR carboxylase family protein [Candidatus Bathyarchaeota archaeon]
MGSEHDMEFASKIKRFLDGEGFTVDCEFRVCSAHRNTRGLLRLLQEYEGEPLVYVTVAGLSDSLSGVVAGNSSQPVIACPPDLERYGWGKAFSSLFTPKGIPVTCAALPENAALAAVRILALYNEDLKEKLQEYRNRVTERSG